MCFCIFCIPVFSIVWCAFHLPSTVCDVVAMTSCLLSDCLLDYRGHSFRGLPTYIMYSSGRKVWSATMAQYVHCVMGMSSTRMSGNLSRGVHSIYAAIGQGSCRLYIAM